VNRMAHDCALQDALYDLAYRCETFAHVVLSHAIPTRSTYSLNWLARILPQNRRDRLVAEVMGDLGVCESRRERIPYVIGIVVGLPRLAWITHYENRRGRA
jgi:hypothetical protein